MKNKKKKPGFLSKIKASKYYQAAEESFWRIWKHKTIWFWGLFIGSGASLDINNSKEPGKIEHFQQSFSEFVSLYWVWIALGIVVIIILILVCWFLSMVARSGIIREFDEKQNKKNHRLSFKKIWLTGKKHFNKMFYLDLTLLALFLSIFLFNGLLAFFVFFAKRNFFAIVLFVLSILVSVLFFAFVMILKPFAQVFILLSNLEIKKSFEKSWEIIKNNFQEFLKLFLTYLSISFFELIIVGIITFIIGIFGLIFYRLLLGNEIQIFVLISIGGILATIVAVSFLTIRSFCSLWRIDILIWWVKMIDGVKAQKKTKKVAEKEEIDSKEVMAGAEA